MLTFKDFRLTVYRRENGEGMVVLDAREPTVGLDADARDRERHEKYDYSHNEAGLHSLSFYMTRADFDRIMSGRVGSLNDCSHNVRAFGELFTFYDLDFPRDVRGRASVPFVNLDLPNYARRILRRAVRMTLAKCEPGGDRREIAISWENRERWMRQYGQGTGKVYVDVLDAAFYDACERDGGQTFAHCIDNLRRIAKNATWRHTDVATVKLSKDWDGWYFRILQPDGRCSMNGGVINHGRDGKHDWSTHT